MFAHYLKIAFRNIWKYKTQSFVAIFGLAFGLACFVPALYWLRYETSYDNFYQDAGQIYRVYSVDKQESKVNELVSGILERKLHEQFPATETSTVFFIEQNDCRTEKTPHIRLHTLFTDSTFFNVFPQVIIAGDAQKPFQIINNIVLTETVAIRLFEDVEKAIGKQIKSTYDSPYIVTAVVKDPPSNTNLSFDAILFHDQIKLQKTFSETSEEQIWAFSSLQMYMRLHPHTHIEALADQLRDFPLQSYANNNIELRMLPVSDVRHRINTDAPFTLNFIRLFVIAGILLLFSAIFNFLSLYIDLFRQRIREFNLRTVHGASSGQLILQMIFELTCSIFLALLSAFFLVLITSPVFSGLLGVEMEMLQLVNLFIICGMGVMLLVLFIGFISFRHLSLLAMNHLSKGKIAGKPILRRLAVTMQLAVSVVFIVTALVVMKQMRYVNYKDLGFDRNGIIYLSGMHPFIEENVRTALMDELVSIPQVENITDTNFTPQHNVNPFNLTTDVEWEGKQQSEKPVFNFITTDNRFAKIFRVNMLEGEWLDGIGGDKVVLNEEAVRVMGLSDPIGSIIRIHLNTEQEYKIVGVVKDFHTLSLRSPIHPTIFITSMYPSNSLYIGTVLGREQETIQRISTILPKIDATFTEITPILLEELYDRLNYSEQAGLQLFSILATVCLLISLFGVYAIATATTQRRRKEIAIRKVAGAKAGDIVHLFFREYTLLGIMAGAVALPLAYLAMSRWLQGYAYRTNIPWWLLAGVLTGVITVVLLTVLGQVLKAAHGNPAEVVKNE